MRSSIDGWHCLQIIVPACRLGDIEAHIIFGNEKFIVIILNTVVVYFDAAPSRGHMYSFKQHEHKPKFTQRWLVNKRGGLSATIRTACSTCGLPAQPYEVHCRRHGLVIRS